MNQYKRDRGEEVFGHSYCFVVIFLKAIDKNLSYKPMNLLVQFRVKGSVYII
jgi:hypothetical protein